MISTIIPWADRHELKKALPSIIQNVREVNGELIIVNLGGNKKLLQKQIDFCKKDIKIIYVKNISRFSKPLAQNIGAKYAIFPYLFFCDCDVILPKHALRNLHGKLLKNAGSFSTMRRVKETKTSTNNDYNLVQLTHELTMKTWDGTKIKVIDSEENVLDGTRSAHGILLVRRSDFEKINGYNRCMVGWGWEDVDIVCRLMLFAKLKHVVLGTALHVSHGDNLRIHYDRKYENRWHNRDCMFRQAISSYNNGNFMGTYIADNKNCKVSVVN